jgi:N-dimethylarginine dimethylaminohydrolase
MTPEFLMAWNKKFNVGYEINPWMNGNVQKVNTQKAHDQWSHLLDILLNICKADIKTISIDNQKIPDIVFTANAAFVHGHTVTMSNFKYEQREPEIPYFKNWFHNNLKLYIEFIPVAFEGAGDALTDSYGNLWIAHGFRTHFHAHEIIQSYYPYLKVHSLELVNPHFYHLDTCFCPLTSGHVIYFPDAFSYESESVIKEVFGDKAIPVTRQDANDFVCNAVECNGYIVVNNCSAKINYELEQAKYSVIETDLTEFMKSGGSAKCLTLRLN